MKSLFIYISWPLKFYDDYEETLERKSIYLLGIFVFVCIGFQNKLIV